jgi:predicted metalloprotease with PDZ domain
VEDLFQRLWADFGQPGRGFTEAELEAVVAAVAGRPLPGYFSRYIRGTEELPVPALLTRAGVEVEARPPWLDEEDVTKARRVRGWAGITWAGGSGPGGAVTAGDRAVIRSVVPDSPAWQAGLTYADEVVAVGGQRVTAVTAPRRLADHPTGRAVEITFFRKESLRSCRITLVENPERRFSFAPEADPTPAARAIRRAWLGI